MKVSIITATWNSEDTISKTIDSCLAQEYKDIEHIFIDGLSMDRTIEIIKTSGLDQKKVFSEKDLGIFDALNKGISRSSGEIIGFLHSDDFFYDSKTVKKIVNLFKKTRCDAIYGDLEYVSKKNRNKIVRYWKSGNYKLKNLKDGWMPPHPTFFMKADLYRRLGNFNTNYKISSDYDAMLRYLSKGDLRIEYIPEVLIKMTLGGNSNKDIRNITMKMKEDYHIMKEHNLPALRCLFGKNIYKIKQFF